MMLTLCYLLLTTAQVLGGSDFAKRRTIRNNLYIDTTQILKSSSAADTGDHVTNNKQINCRHTHIVTNRNNELLNR